MDHILNKNRGKNLFVMAFQVHHNVFSKVSFKLYLMFYAETSFLQGKHLSKCLTLSGALSPVAGNAAHVDKVSLFCCSLLLSLFKDHLVFFNHSMHHLSNLLIPISLPLSFCLISSLSFSTSD